jgi:hypothetical protein
MRRITGKNTQRCPRLARRGCSPIRKTCSCLLGIRPHLASPCSPIPSAPLLAIAALCLREIVRLIKPVPEERI